MRGLIFAAGLFALAATPGLAQPAEDAAILANRLTGTELVLSANGQEIARGAIVSTAVDTCRLDLMWTGGADLSANLADVRLLDWNGTDTFYAMELGEDQPWMRFVVGPDRYEAALGAFQRLARACGSDPQRPVRIVRAPGR